MSSVLVPFVGTRHGGWRKNPDNEGMSTEHPHPAPHPKQAYNSAGDGWTYLTELNDPNSTPEGEGRPVPEVRLQEKLDHATVIRLSFRHGDLMDDHHAPGPILVIG